MDEARHFEIEPTLSAAWQSLRRRLAFYIRLTLLTLGIASLGAGLFVWANHGALLIFLLVPFAISVGIVLGFVHIVLRDIHGESLGYSGLLAGRRYALRGVIISLVSGALPAAAMALHRVAFYTSHKMISYAMLIVLALAIYANIRWFLWPAFVIDRHYSALGAMRASWIATEAVTARFALLLALLGAFVVVGSIALGLGIWIGFPLTSFSLAHVYLSLLPQMEREGSLAALDAQYAQSSEP